MWRVALLLAAAAATTGAAAPEPPSDAEAVVAGFVDASPYPLLERLGRWDGTTFVPVTAGTIDNTRVIAVTHGWAPGVRASYDQLQAASDTLVTIWDPALRTSSGEPALVGLETMVEAIATAEPEAAVVFFSWVDQSATAADPFDARQGEDATEINGHRMAVAIEQALTEDWSGDLHLIGHSFGANVATTAALALDVTTRQLTVMDSPDDELARLGGAGNDLRYKLARLGIGRADGSTFVDNYISEVGIRYGDLPGLGAVVDVRLHPPSGSDFGASHDYPPIWYAQALDGGPESTGDPPTGPWWSPLLGGDPTQVGAYYEAEDDAQPTVLIELDGPPPVGVAEELAFGVDRLELATGSSDVIVNAEVPVVETSFTTTDRSLLLAFTVGFGGADAGATVTVAVDGRERFTAVGPSYGDGRAGSFVQLWDVEPGAHRLTAVLTDGGAGAAATLSYLRIVEAADIVRDDTEEQTTALVVAVVVAAGLVVLALIVAVVLLVRAVLRRRKRRAAAS